MHARTTTLATIAILAAALTGCSADEPSQGKAERATAAASAPASSTPDCGPDSGLTQAEWTEQCSSASPAAEEQPDTELSVGDTFAYTDGLKVKVDSIKTITRFGEYDDRPEADRTAFRVTFTITNGTKKPYDLEGFGYDAQGATTGGQTETIYVELGSKLMTGRLAPGRDATFTSDYTLAKSDGKDVLFTVSRMDKEWLEDGSFLGEDPNWTGAIK
jgi:ribosomal protein L12E/L44/L45/RPP1/RPP2